jgi:hypothetical protein
VYRFKSKEVQRPDEAKMDSVENGVMQEVALLRDRLASIEKRQSEKKPWFKDASTIIALAAFVFSFGTTIFSYKRASDENIHNLKTELRTILQRLVALPKENIEASQKYKISPDIVGSFSGLINQENLLLTKQAGEIIGQLPLNQVSATDFITVAQALLASRDVTDAFKHLQNALAVSTLLAGR